MPTVEVRDSIEGVIETDVLGFGYMTRRINLAEGHKFSIRSIDIFNDNGIMPLRADPANPQNAAYQIYVSPYPMQQVSGDWGFSIPANNFVGGGQSAGEPNVLYKEIGVTASQDATFFLESGMHIVRFPNDCIASTPTFTWFSPHVYVTVMVWNAPETALNIHMSCYMKLSQTKANPTSLSMGMYSEFLDSQIKGLTSTAIVVDPANVAGKTFPSWKFGGIRPEVMLSGQTALRYFNRLASNASQLMVGQGDLLTAFRSATSMVPYDEGFGDAAANLPEWITLMNVQGVTAGPIRQYPPPLKYADNGNTLML